MDMARLAAEHGLERVGGRPSLPQYVKQLLNRSDFTYTLAKYRMQSENERNRLGMAWVLLRPSFSLLIYGTVFGVIMQGATATAGLRAIRRHGVFILEFFNTR